MGIKENLTPVHYKVLGMEMTRSGSQVSAKYRIVILNEDGRRLSNHHPVAVLTAQEQAAVVAIYERDKAQFEAATGWTEWTGELD